MTFLTIFKEPSIIIITSSNLKPVTKLLQTLNKKELSYRFKQLDEFMSGNIYTSTAWEDFKKALIFPDKIFGTNQSMNSNADYATEIYLTVDASYFFHEESLIFSKINHKFIQIMPTLLTGMGPFFTFLNMAIAFTAVNFSASTVDSSLNELIGKIQVAALCSVFAVGYSLLFMFIERIVYNEKCKKYYVSIQKELIRLFDVCTSEQFLLDLVKESKIQGVNNEKFLQSLPEDFAKATAKSLGEITTPYLENILYSLNKLNESVNKGGGGSDVVDKLF